MSSVIRKKKKPEQPIPYIDDPQPPPREVIYKGHVYDIHPQYVRAKDIYHWDNCFWIFLLIFFFCLAIVWTVGFWVYPPANHTHIIAAAAASVGGGESGDAPLVFRLAEIRPRDEMASHPGQCTVGEIWDADIQMCGPKVSIPDPFDSSIMDGHAGTCNTFFGSMCGKWNQAHNNSDRTFSYGYWRNQHRLERLIKEAPVDSPIGQMYKSCYTVGEWNTKQENKLEWQHVSDRILGEFRSYADLPVVFGRLARQGYTAPFSFSIERHPLEPRMLPLITWDGVLNATDVTVTEVFHSTEPLTHYAGMHMYDKIRRTMKIIKAMNDHNTEPIDEIVDYMDYLKNGGFHDDLMFYKDLPTWKTPHPNKFAWQSYFQALDGTGLRIPQDYHVWVIGKPYLHWLLEEGLAQFEIMDWKAYLEFLILYNTHQFAPQLPSNVYFRQWDIQGPVGPDSTLYHRVRRSNHTGAPQKKDCVRIVQHMIPGLVAEAFLNTIPYRHEIQKEIRGMTQRILSRYKKMMQDTPWLSPQGKQALIDKIDSVVVRVMEPNEWHVEPFAQRISHERWAHNLNMIRRYRVQQNLKLWHKDRLDRLDRNAIAFFSSPLSAVNAYYSGPTNTITVLAGILQHPFFDIQFKPVAKEAIVGSVIAHELGHLAGLHGLHWDHNGSFKPNGILTQADMEQFYQRTRCVIHEYGANTPVACNFTNDEYGRHTLSESLADLIGIRLSYNAYFDPHMPGEHASLGDKQRFFMVFGQAWCSVSDTQHMCQRMARDVHARPDWRVDKTLRNFKPYHDVFACRTGTSMYKNPNEVCLVYGK